eukprot:TRINITY_DN1271_c0_g2_i4.p1 TRINITY_DN1271_c0_g2~~TRINITY_DN1271_c0_g2_i4.p1  ORF type:complete len:408 (+),score=78.61 TRINITY_DN1271_c0_g2_i4:187-1410(+)
MSARNAIILASIFEFFGTVLMGGFVSSTLKSSIVSPVNFSDNPDFFATGMLSTMITSMIWVLIASYFGLPVSTTQTIIGGIVGFGVVEKGFAAINDKVIRDILLSWVISPVVGAIVSCALYFVVRETVFNAKLNNNVATNGSNNSYTTILLTLYSTLTILILGAFVLISNQDMTNWGPYTITGVLIVTGIATAFGSYWMLTTKKKQLISAINLDETVPDKMGYVDDCFKFLMAVTASFVAFAHGSNDVSNSAGPYAAIVEYMLTGSVTSAGSIPFFVIVGGGVGIVIGCAMFGYNVMETVGKKITKLTFVKGYCAQLGAACTVLFASTLSLPISTTAVLVGSVAGIGFMRSEKAIQNKDSVPNPNQPTSNGVDKSMLLKIVLGWILTVFVGFCGTAVTYSIIKVVFY